MPSIENEPLEVRKAHAISELEKIVNQSTSLDQARQLCKQKMIELVEQGIVRSAGEDVDEIKIIVREKMDKKFEDQAKAKDRARKYSDEAEKLAKSGDYRSAIKLYQKAIDSDPNEPIYYNNQGYFYQRQGRYEEAIAVYEKAIELDPNELLYKENLSITARNMRLRSK